MAAAASVGIQMAVGASIGGTLLSNLFTEISVFKKIIFWDLIQWTPMSWILFVNPFLPFRITIGVLFSIEVTATYYLVENLWRAFFVVGTTELIFRLIHRLGTGILLTIVIHLY
jgi:hypothetical protein